MCRLGLTGLFALLFFSCSLWAGDVDAQVVSRGKDATVLIDAGGGAFGSGFCIDKAGLFITNCHVVADHPTVKIVIRAGETNQAILVAEVLKRDAEADLAILQVKPARPLVSLDLGDTAGLIETTPVIAFGYPFGKALALQHNEFPNISVSTGKITSLRKEDGVLKMLQLDAVLNPGNSGGPVIDAKGRVLGIVCAGIPGRGINFAIPVGDLNTFLREPVVSFSPPELTLAQLRTTQTLAFHVLSLQRKPDNLSVEFTVSVVGEPPQLIKPTLGADGTCSFPLVILSAKGAAPRFEATVVMPSGIVTGTLVDSMIHLKGKTIPLSTVAQVEFGTSVSVTPNDGEPQVGQLADFKAIQVLVEGQTKTLDLTKATLLTISAQGEAPPRVDFKITILADGKVLKVQTGSFSVVGVATPVQPLPHGNPTASVAPPSTPTPAGQVPSSPLRPNSPDEVTPTAPVTDLPTSVTAAETIVKLPGTADALVDGGGGRYLAIYLRSLKKIAIFDCTTAQIARYISVPAENGYCCAGMTKLVVVFPDDSTIQRWDLATGAKELALPMDQAASITSVSMGSFGEGPVCVSGWQCFDLKTLKLVDLKDSSGRVKAMSTAGGGYRLTGEASSDGRSFGTLIPEILPNGTVVRWPKDHNSDLQQVSTTIGWVIPSNGCTQIYTTEGLFGADLKPLEKDKFGNLACLPTCHPGYFFSIEHTRDPRRIPTLGLYSTNNRQLITYLPFMDELRLDKSRDYSFATDFMPFRRFLKIIPQAKLIVSLNAERDALILRRFDLIDHLQTVGVNYLFVNSVPPSTIGKGSQFEYKLEISSDHQGFKYSLQDAPAGMQISAAGVVQWHIPADFHETVVSCTIHIKNEAGLETDHILRLNIR